MSDEPKTAIHQEVQLHQMSEAELWNYHFRKKRGVLICNGGKNFAQTLKPSDNGGKEVEPTEKKEEPKNCCICSTKPFSQIGVASQQR